MCVCVCVCARALVVLCASNADVDLIDTTGTLFAMAKFADLIGPDGDFEGRYR